MELQARNSRTGAEPSEQHATSPSDVESHCSSVSPTTWKNPRINIWRFLATLYCFAILGMNDAVYGALIPYLEEYYNISYTVVSLLFLSPVVGYITSASLNNMIHMRLGQRGVAMIGPGAHLVAYIITCLHPPYPALVVVCVLAGFGNGLADAAWNAWVGALPNANELLGILHACYGAGAMIAPTIATALITKANRQWYEFYYVLAGMAFLELVSLTMAFWNATADEYRASHPTTQFIATSEAHEQAQRWLNRAVKRVFGNSRTAEALKSRVTWVCSIFLTAYVGVEVAIGGWVVVFMLRVRGGGPFPSGMTSTGFWAGLTIGRVILGFVTPRLFKSEKHAIIVYLGISLAFELLFWLIPNFYVSAVMVSFLGFFLGPLFPAAIVAATKLLPKQLHVPAIGFAAAVGASGATVLPFAVGAIANSRGVWVLQPFILAILVACLGIWLCLPSLTKKVQ